ncbi:MAG: TetR family transcriptional regulator [Propionibacteriaceae bacterium]|nr:TetR/AcrR family transcriptional regulator [Micropruina sp.]HBX81786.1 TetR family transcriptional regulator [Propionibacteriaceae bacterium]HBY24115.1 TetR family transcriptional regulator [Propionibacteriaceae bacterium]
MRRLPLAVRRAELIDAAVRVIARDGLAKASTRAIVAEADMPLGAFHYVFRTREDMMRALVTEVVDKERSAALAAFEAQGSDTDLRSMLRAGLGSYLALLKTRPDLELAMLEVALYGVRHDATMVADQWQSYHRAAAEGLEKAAELCGVTWRQPIEHVAQSLISAFDGITLTWIAIRDAEAAERHMDFLADSFARLAS